MEVLELRNGLKILVDRRVTDSVAIAIAVKIGSIHEDPRYRGVSHIVEHMLLKSNRFYSARDISRIVELSGGVSNSFTHGDATFVVCEVLRENFRKVVHVLYTAYTNEKFLDEEFEKERNVVLAEVKEIFENPSERIEVLGPLALFGKSDLGDPVAGYPETIERVTREYAEEFKRRYYTPDNTLIAVSGGVSDEQLKYLTELFSKVEGTCDKKKEPSREGSRDIVEYCSDTDTAYLTLAYELPPSTDPRMVEVATFNLTYGATSILFDRIREELGAAYAMDSLYDIYSVAGYMQVVVPSIEVDAVETVERIVDESVKSVVNGELNKQYLEGRKKLYKFITRPGYRTEFDVAYTEAFLAVKGIVASYEEHVESVLSRDWGDLGVGLVSRAKAIILPS